MLGIVSLILGGCATVRIQSDLAPLSDDASQQPKPIHATAGLLFGPQQGPYACGDIDERFFEMLQRERVFDRVNIMQPSDQSDLILEARFACRDDRHLNSGIVMGAIEGLGLMIPTVFPLRDYDYFVDATVAVRRGNTPLKTYQVSSHIDANMTYWAMLRYNYRPPQAAEAALQDVTYQVIRALRQDRAALEAR